MKLSIGIVVLAAGVGSARVLNAQTPAKPKVVQVSANTTPAPADTRRAAPPNAQVATSPAEASDALKAAGGEVLISRETYSYPGGGRRDPFVSLMNTEELRPLLTDLKLVAIGFDPAGRNSVAVLRDMSNKEQYRVKVGQAIGRMRVASIHEKKVVFGIEEFGYSRQETLAMSDSTKVRTQ
ncbi:MAG: hypothetical protein M3R07_12310 [Gemmatimonadota bacterium]|nr:hypothetical protein [Gemmatimonadota bacterium]